MAQTIAARWIVRLERLKHDAYANACDKMRDEIVASRWNSGAASPVYTFKDGSRMQRSPSVGLIELKPVKLPKVKVTAAKAGK